MTTRLIRWLAVTAGAAMAAALIATGGANVGTGTTTLDAQGSVPTKWCPLGGVLMGQC